jgi:hypothetical protein
LIPIEVVAETPAEKELCASWADGLDLVLLEEIFDQNPARARLVG